jgi:Rrf2 family iron-sulfur cluster assembly transcriptional regulator
MKLTTKGKYAVMALIDIAIYSNNGPTSLNIISQRQKISISYLEQLFVKLRRFGIVKSYKGPGGGYILAKNLQDITIAQIIKAVDEDLDARTCHGLANCHENKKCLAHDLWSGLTQHVYDYLDGISLLDVLPKNDVKVFPLKYNTLDNRI